MTTILTAPLFDPGMARSVLEVPAGLSVAQMVTRAMPGLSALDRAQLRVTLVTGQGASPLHPHLWGQIRPKPGVRLVIRPVPGNSGGLRSVLLAVVSIAALALAPQVAGLIGVTGKFGTSLIALGLNLVGAALVNAMVPLTVPDQDKARNRYTLSGWTNTQRRDEPVPYPLGRHRYAPPFAAMSYSEIVGDQQYIRALFCFGYGPLDISDIRIGDTPITDYDEVEMEIREGREDDAPVTLYPRQVLEDAEQVELVRPRPRDDAGKRTSGEAIETPVVRVTASNTQIISLLLWFPSGLIRHSREDSFQLGVEVRIRARLSDEDDWSEVNTLKILAKTSDPFFRQFTWQPPTRGKWQVEITRMTPERTNNAAQDRVMLAAIQSIRPEYPVNFDKPLALIAIRIRATYQLNGQLDALNAIVQREALDWDGETWAKALSRNPAAAYVAALTGPANPYPAGLDELDWDQLQDWHAFCADKGLKYDRIHETAESLGDMLRAICAAGRATPRHDGLRWGVVIDRPQELVVDHLNPRNSYDFRWSRQYFDPPHAIRVTFNDETNDYEPAERLIRWPGYEGPILITEELALPGKTDPDEIWIEVRRRMYEILHRADTFTCMQDGGTRTATRGDRVMVSQDVLDRTQVAARVRQVSDGLVELDTPVTMEAGQSYGLRFRVFANAEDSLGASVLATVAMVPGETVLLSLSGTTALPAVGDLVHFGERATESLSARVLSIEPGETFSAQLTLIPEAAIIDELTDAEVPEAWDGAVGEAIALTLDPPLAPRFVDIDSSVYGSVFGDLGTGGTDLLLTVQLRAGDGETGYLSGFRVEHRLKGTLPWTSITTDPAAGGIEIAGYEDGALVELRAVAIAVDGTEGAHTVLVEHTIGTDATALPDDLEAGSIMVSGGLGNATISMGIPEGGTTAVQLYRVPGGDTLDEELHAIGAPVSVSPGTTATVVDGDATRQTLITNGGFDTADDWTAGMGWTIEAGAASHAAPFDADLSQAVPLIAGNVMALAFTVGGRSNGAITPALTGGSAVTGDAISSNARQFVQLTVASGNSALAFQPGGTFDGAIDAVTLYIRTAACAPQGVWDYYFKPINDDGAEAALSGPATVEIA